MSSTKLRWLKELVKAACHSHSIICQAKHWSLKLNLQQQNTSIMKSALILKQAVDTLHKNRRCWPLARSAPSILPSLSLSLCCPASFQMHRPHVILSLLSQITPPIPPESLEAQAAQKAAQCVQAWRDWISAHSLSIQSLINRGGVPAGPRPARVHTDATRPVWWSPYAT